MAGSWGWSWNKEGGSVPCNWEGEPVSWPGPGEVPKSWEQAGLPVVHSNLSSHIYPVPPTLVIPPLIYSSALSQQGKPRWAAKGKFVLLSPTVVSVSWTWCLSAEVPISVPHLVLCPLLTSLASATKMGEHHMLPVRGQDSGHPQSP